VITISEEELISLFFIGFPLSARAKKSWLMPQPASGIELTT
jgi:hypothetical protein